MSETFLDWRWVVGNVLMFSAIAGPILIMAGRLRRAFENREDELERRVDERTQELEAGNESLHRQVGETQRAYSDLVGSPSTPGWTDRRALGRAAR
jgi:C4-dicarboxylate-specific signal transduction histidine kinase